MTDAAIIAISVAVSGAVVAAINGYFGYKIKKTADTTLQHVNHERIAQAQRYAVSCRVNADLSTNESYKKIAETAEAELSALVKSQESIDRGSKP